MTKKFIRIIKTTVLFVGIGLFLFALTACSTTIKNTNRKMNNVIKTLEVQYRGTDDENSVTQNVRLINKVNGYDVFWFSDKPNVISNEGKLTLPKEDQTVKLTAKVIRDNITKIKTFNLKVAGTNPPTTIYLVMFNYNDGSPLEQHEITWGHTVVPPFNPTRAGHRFVGWYDSTSLTTEFDFETPITRHVMVYAKWEYVQYSITYLVDDVAYGDVELYDLGDAIIPRPEPTKVGHTFLGWQTVLPSKMPKEDLVVKGYFRVNTYEARFVDTDNKLLYATTFNYGTNPVFEGVLPTMASTELYDYNFIGWALTVDEVTLNHLYVAQFEQVAKN